MLMAGCGQKETTNEESLKNIIAVPAAKSTISIEDEFAGEVKASSQAGVVSKVPGKVSKVFVDTGNYVKKGDVLFQLDSSDAAAQLNQAKAGVEAARLNLERVKGSGYSQSLIQAETAAEQARLAYDNARTNYDKYKSLFDAGGVSKSELDNLETRMLTAKEQYESAVDNLELLKEGLGPDSIEAARAQLNQALAAQKLIETQIRNMTVTAPISGIVSERNINEGEGVSTAAPAVVISDIDSLAAEFQIPEHLINKLKPEMKLTVTVEALNNRELEGQIEIVNPVADKRTRKYRVKVNLSDKNNQLKPGMFAKISVETEIREEVLTVPNEAVVSEKGLQYVYTARKGVVAKNPVSIGLTNHKMSEVTEGLAVGDMVILEGQSFLAEGEKVNVVSR